ncbi:Protein CBG19643 [Caenorhabditis briggsae]|uniref:Protein CBG19643 n=1 Tax=Caenorhabditis briggsae TaxID=6238 RepID=A8XW33_CAEBR|nr:Protein CBG19643 [Caenorhabditis briggsae]CAP36852.1 Protein CBG19643 [Caenorhabditis briggsae]
MSDNEFTGSETLPIDLLLEKDPILKQIELKIDAITEKLAEHGQKFNEISDKLQSIENLTAKISKIDEDVEAKDTVPKQAAEKSFILKHVFENVEHFVKGRSYEGGSENHFNVVSCIALQRLNDHLACFVSIRGPKEEVKWEVETKVDIKIDGPNQISKAESCNHCFERNEGWGFPKFLEWEEMKNEYLVDGKLTVEAHVQLIESSGFSKEKIQKFDESTKEDSDVVLVVNKKEFYVLRKYLAAQSSFFKALLLGDSAESKKPKVTLAGIDPDDFHYFLEVLHGELAIDEYNIEGILLIANTYGAKTAIRRCENFLLNESKNPLKKKLQMAVRYNLKNLKNKCMEEIQTFHQLSSVIPSDINDLDHKLMGELLKKAILLH